MWYSAPEISGRCAGKPPTSKRKSALQFDSATSGERSPGCGRWTYACPCGWTYQLVKRNMWVYSVDNVYGAKSDGYRAGDVAVWEDGFKFRPTRSNISWMVCYSAETTAVARIVVLMAGAVKLSSIFKPPMKTPRRRSHNLAYIQAQLDEHGINAQIQARQLYHAIAHIARPPYLGCGGWSSRRATGKAGALSRPATLSVRLLPKKLQPRAHQK